MAKLDDARIVAQEIVQAEKGKDVPNEVKKRTAVANVNAFLVSNPDVHLTDKEVDELVEEEVAKWV